MVDLAVLHCSPSVGSLSEVQALVAGKPNMIRVEEAIYHIALFLEFNMLAQGCEDIIAEIILLDALIAILKWSSHPYGSKWVHRQALHFLCEEFSQVMTSDVFYELSKDHLLTAIQSDYLQVIIYAPLEFTVVRMCTRKPVCPPLLSHPGRSAHPGMPASYLCSPRCLGLWPFVLTATITEQCEPAQVLTSDSPKGLWQ